MDKTDIIKRLSAQNGHIGFFCEDLITGESFELNKSDRFLAASVIKLPIFMCISKWVKEGKADFTEKITVRNEDKLPLCGALTLFSDEPSVDIRTLCNLMISLSDNTATNLLINKFGISAYADEFIKIGLSGTSLNRLLFDKKASDSGVENYMVLSEIAMLLKNIYKGTFVCEQTSKDIVNTLLLQQFNHKITGIIGEGTVPVAHKTGEDDGISNDVALVYAKRPFIICFAGNGTNTAEFDSLIRNVSYDIFLEYNR